MSRFVCLLSDCVWDDSHATATKIGGKVCWPNEECEVAIRQGCSNLTCTNCGLSLLLVSQSYAPLVSYHRMLLLWCCKNSACHNTQNGWLSIQLCWKDAADSACVEDREEDKDHTDAMHSAVESGKKKAGGNSWKDSWDDDDAMDDGDLDAMLAQLQVTSSVAANGKKPAAKKNSKGKATPKKHMQEGKPPAAIATDGSSDDGSSCYDPSLSNAIFSPYYLQVTPLAQWEKGNASSNGMFDDHDDEAEPSDISPTSSSYVHAMEQGDGEEGVSDYEEESAENEAWLHFMTTVSACPGQCCRYAKNGTAVVWPLPLAMRPSPACCSSCSHPMTWEVQWMPACFSSLVFLHHQSKSEGWIEDWENDLLRHESWMNVASLCVGTCTRPSCAVNSPGRWQKTQLVWVPMP